MKKIVIVIKELKKGHREQIRAAAESHGYTVCFFDTNQEAYGEAADAEIVFGAGADLLQAAGKVRWFHAQSAGVDVYLEPGVMVREDVLLSNSSGAYGVTLAEHAIMLTLELLRRQLTFNAIVAQRKWDQTPTFRSILGSRVTILGTGDIGREIAKRIRSFQPACIVGVNRRGVNPDAHCFDHILTQEQADKVLPETDILLIALPGTAKTAHFMDAGRLSLLPSHAVLVNVGRGSALDQYALKDALDEGKIAGAALDVFEREPLEPEDSLWNCRNLLITPHVGGNMTLGYTVDRCVSIFLEDFENYTSGRPLSHRIDKSIGY